jgi:hypothetical protein
VELRLFTTRPYVKTSTVQCKHSKAVFLASLKVVRLHFPAQSIHKELIVSQGLATRAEQAVSEKIA